MLPAGEPPIRRRRDRCRRRDEEVHPVDEPGSPERLVKHRATLDDERHDVLAREAGERGAQERCRRRFSAALGLRDELDLRAAATSAVRSPWRAARPTAVVTIITGPASSVESRRAAGGVRRRRSNTTRVSGRAR